MPSYEAGGLQGIIVHQVTFDTDGNAYVTVMDDSAGHGTVYRFSSSGTAVTTVLLDVDSPYISAVSIGPDGKTAYVRVAETNEAGDEVVTTVQVVSSPGVL